MSWVGRHLPHAQPSDLVFIGYVALSGLVIIVFGWQLAVPLWLTLIASHSAMLGIAFFLARQPTRDGSWYGVLRDAYPVIFIALLYWELRYLGQLFGSGFNDAIILRLEEALFGEQLAMTFSERLPMLWLSEVFHFFYAIYWALLPLAGAMLYLRRKYVAFRKLVYVELVVFFFCYLVFTFFPVAGPHYEFPLIGEPLSNGILYQFVHWVLEDGGSKGAAFPSSHVAVAVAVLVVGWRHDRAVFATMLPLVLGLTIGTVYGRFHYGIDALLGVVTGLLVVPLALYVEPWFRVTPGAAVGNRGAPMAV